MAATVQLVRRIALALPGVEEGLCHGTPAFYVRSKLMLRMWEDGEMLVVRFPKEKRASLIEENPDVFSVTDHYRNYPAVLLNLLAVDRKLLERMIESAWRMQASRKAVAAYDLSRSKSSSSPRPSPPSDGGEGGHFTTGRRTMLR